MELIYCNKKIKVYSKMKIQNMYQQTGQKKRKQFEGTFFYRKKVKISINLIKLFKYFVVKMNFCRKYDIIRENKC